MSTVIVPLNLDSLVEAMEARPATRTRLKAWCWLAEQTTVGFIDDALIVESATWSATTYLATPDHCTCQARGHCWHKESAAIVAAAQAEDARYDALEAAEMPLDALPFTPTRAEQRARAYADVMELFA